MTNSAKAGAFRRGLLAIAITLGSSGTMACVLSDGVSQSHSSALVDASLITLSFTTGTLAPAFTPTQHSYEAFVARGVSSVSVVARASTASAKISVNGAYLPQGAQTDAIPLALGVTTITLVVTAEDDNDEFPPAALSARSPARAV